MTLKDTVTLDAKELNRLRRRISTITRKCRVHQFELSGQLGISQTVLSRFIHGMGPLDQCTYTHLLKILDWLDRQPQVSMMNQYSQTKDQQEVVHG